MDKYNIKYYIEKLPKELLVHYIIPCLTYDDFGQFMKAFSLYLTENDYHTMVKINYARVPDHFKKHEWSIGYLTLLSSDIIPLHSYNKGSFLDIPVNKIVSEDGHILDIWNIDTLKEFLCIYHPNHIILYFGNDYTGSGPRFEYMLFYKSIKKFLTFVRINEEILLIRGNCEHYVLIVDYLFATLRDISNNKDEICRYLLTGRVIYF